MSSSELCTTGHTLTTLPLPILVRILRYLCPHKPFDRTNRRAAPFFLAFKDPRITFSLHCAQELNVPLPLELLAPALASPVLAAAAANILGDRVSYLTHCNTSGTLVAWIEAFAPYVKAVSTMDSFPQWFESTLRGGEARTWKRVFETQLEYSLRLFKTLSIHGVTLQVLDLQDVHFSDLTILEDEIMAGLCTALESNSGTLRELALPALRTSEVCDRALQMSNLKKLDVLTAKVWPARVAHDSEPLPSPIVRMIRAVDGHADRSRKLTTLRELRFLNVDSLGYSSLTASDRECTVFLSVKTLRILMLPGTSVSTDSDPFISSFTNLERLFWNLCPDSYDESFEKLCTKIREVHLCDVNVITALLEVGNVQCHGSDCSFFSRGSDLRNYGSGAITSIDAGAISEMETRTMAMHCPRLENLSAHVRRDNIRAIRKLVTKCQQMKWLELMFDEGRNGRLETEDWHAISRIVPKSHKNLCQVWIQTHGIHIMAAKKLKTVFRCFGWVAKALGDRARGLAFSAGFRTNQGASIVERVCELLDVCMQHTPALESLDINVRIAKDRSDYNRGWGKRVVRRFIDTESQLLQEVQSLRILRTGISALLFQQLDWSDDLVETDARDSETEWTSSSL